MAKKITILAVLILLVGLSIIGVYFVTVLNKKTQAPEESAAATTEETNPSVTAIECTPTTNQVINFETIPGSTPTDGMAISNQFENGFNVSFSNGPRVTASNGVIHAQCDKQNPVLAKYGPPETAFRNGDADGNPEGGAPIADGVYPDFQNQLGTYFLTDDGTVVSTDPTIGRIPCSLIIDFTVPTYEYSFDIIDIDGGETWTVESYDENGTLINTTNVQSDTAHGLNARPKRVAIIRQETPIWQIQVKAYEPKEASDWGLAFDNFSPVCAETPPELDPLEIQKSAQITSVTATDAVVSYDVSVHNPNSQAIDDVIVRDNLPDFVANVTNIQVGSGQANFVASGHYIEWTIPTIDANQTLNMSYDATYLSANYGPVDNTAIVYVDDNSNDVPDPEEEDDRDSEEVVIDINLAASISKSHTITKTDTNTVVSYSLNVVNLGDVDLLNYSVRDTLDSKVNASWVGNISNSGVLESGQIIWEGLNISVGQSLLLTYQISVPLDVTGTFTNLAILYNNEDEEIDQDDDEVILKLPDTALEFTGITWVVGVYLIAVGIVFYIYIFHQVWILKTSVYQNRIEKNLQKTSL